MTSSKLTSQAPCCCQALCWVLYIQPLLSSPVLSAGARRMAVVAFQSLFPSLLSIQFFFIILVISLWLCDSYPKAQWLPTIITLLFPHGAASGTQHIKLIWAPKALSLFCGWVPMRARWKPNGLVTLGGPAALSPHSGHPPGGNETPPLWDSVTCHPWATASPSAHAPQHPRLARLSQLFPLFLFLLFFVTCPLKTCLHQGSGSGGFLHRAPGPMKDRRR